MVTLAALERRGLAALREAGVQAPAFELDCLLETVTGLDRTARVLQADRPAADGWTAQLDRLIARRRAGEPLQYLLGWWEFYGVRLTVTPAVLIPQPDTEVLVEEALRRLRPGMRAADLCSGSGCIAIVLAGRVPDARVTAVEYDPDAFEVLCRNRAADARANLEALRGDVLDPTWPDRLAPLDLIVSNPPYVRTEELSTLPDEVRREPRIALDGGPDGLRFYRGIARLWRTALRPGGWLLFEVGYDQAEPVAAILREAGYRDLVTRRDYGGHLRVVGARRPVEE